MTRNARLGGVFLRGSLWGLLGQGLQYGSLFIGSIVLARLLDPKDFGAAAMALGVAGLAVGVCQMGFSSALVARPDMTESEGATLMWFHVLMGTAMAALVWWGAPVIAHYLHKPSVEGLIKLAVPFVFASIAAPLFLARLQSQMRIGAHQAVMGLAVLSGSVVSCVAAWKGAGAASLVMGMVWTAGCQLIAAFVLSGMSLKFYFNPIHLRRHADFGGSAWLTNLINLVINNGTPLVLGRVWMTHDLGLFQFAQRRMQQPFQLLTGFMGAVMFPVLRRLRDDEVRLRAAVMDVTRTSALFIVPLYILLIVFAREWIVFLYGQTWEPASELFQILALGVFARVFCVAASNTFYACERPQEGLRNALVRLVVWLPLMAFVLIRHGWSATAVAWGWTGMETTACLLYASRLCRILDVRWNDIVREFSGLMHGLLFLVLWSGLFVALSLLMPARNNFVWVLLWGLMGLAGYVWNTRFLVGRLLGWVRHSWEQG